MQTTQADTGLAQGWWEWSGAEVVRCLEGEAVGVLLRALGVEDGGGERGRGEVLWGLRLALVLLHPDQGEVVEAGLGVVERWVENAKKGASLLEARVVSSAPDGNEGEPAEDLKDEGELLLKLTLTLLGVLERTLAFEVQRVGLALWREVGGVLGREIAELEAGVLRGRAAKAAMDEAQALHEAAQALDDQPYVAFELREQEGAYVEMLWGLDPHVLKPGQWERLLTAAEKQRQLPRLYGMLQDRGWLNEGDSLGAQGVRERLREMWRGMEVGEVLGGMVRRGEVEQAKVYWRRVQAQVKQTPDVSWYVAKLAEACGDWDRARGAYGVAVDSGRWGVRALAGMARVLGAKGERRGAIETFEAAFARGHMRAKDALSLAWIFLENGQLAQAERWRHVGEEMGARARWIVALDHGLASGALGWARECVREGRWAEAEGCLELARRFGGVEGGGGGVNGGVIGRCEAAVGAASGQRSEAEERLLLLWAEDSLRGAQGARCWGRWMVGLALDGEAKALAQRDGWFGPAMGAAAGLADRLLGETQPWHMVLVAVERLLDRDLDTAQMAAQVGLQQAMGALGLPADDEDALKQRHQDAALLWLINAEIAHHQGDIQRAATCVLQALKHTPADDVLVACAFTKLSVALDEQMIAWWLEALVQQAGEEAAEALQRAIEHAPENLYAEGTALSPQTPSEEDITKRLRARFSGLGLDLPPDALAHLTDLLLDVLDARRDEDLTHAEALEMLCASLSRRHTFAANVQPSPSARNPAPGSAVLLAPRAGVMAVQAASPNTLPWQRSPSARASDAMRPPPSPPSKPLKM